MAKRVSKKQKEFAAEYVKTGNGTRSALKVYDTDDYGTANSIAVENLQKPVIQNLIKSIADRIPNELLEEKHIALLNKLDEKGGIDVQAVSKGLDMGYKLKGNYAPEKKHIEVENAASDYVKELADRINAIENTHPTGD